MEQDSELGPDALVDVGEGREMRGGVYEYVSWA